MNASAAPSSREGVDLDACWSRIGNQGDRSCPLLPQHVHCRNCSKYGAAGRAILDRAAPENARPSRSEPLELRRSSLREQTRSLMVFTLGAERFGLPTDICVEVVEARSIHSLPHRRRGVVIGIANVRGTLLPCISLGALLRAAPSPESKARRERGWASRLLVLAAEGGPVGVPVDDVHGVATYEVGALKAVPITLAQSGTCHTLGIVELDGYLVGVLDGARLAQAVGSGFG
jgi:chemotaxis-related protein WspD